MLIEGSRKIGIQQETIKQRFPYNSPDELKVLEMLGVNIGKWIWLECVPILRGDEQRVIGIEQRFRELQIPFPCESACILTFFSFERDLELSF